MMASHPTSRLRGLALWLVGAALAGLAWVMPPIAQPLHYHAFADQRACLGVANCLNTLSNALFVPVGLAGLAFLAGKKGRRAFAVPGEAMPYALFFFAVLLVGMGSAYYHLAPDNNRLLWDRAAISLAMMSFFSAIIAERLGVAIGLRLLPLLCIAGLGSVAYWGLSEFHGQGDLRPYILIQLIPILLIPLLLSLYPPRYSRGRDILIVIALYLLAMLCEPADRLIFELTRVISGHTVKHLIAALAAFWVLIGLRRRRELQ